MKSILPKLRAMKIGETITVSKPTAKKYVSSLRKEKIYLYEEGKNGKVELTRVPF
jgi:Mn-dependent DtxR family transcriptional regulator